MDCVYIFEGGIEKMYLKHKLLKCLNLLCIGCHFYFIFPGLQKSSFNVHEKLLLC